MKNLREKLLLECYKFMSICSNVLKDKKIGCKKFNKPFLKFIDRRQHERDRNFNKHCDGFLIRTSSKDIQNRHSFSN